MGVTIYYSGHLPDLSRLPLLVAAIQEAAARRDWPYELIDERILGTAETLVSEVLGPPDILTLDDGTEIEVENVGVASEYTPVDDRWRGIIVAPPESEPVWITFGRDGGMITYLAGADAYTQPGTYLANTELFTKTQFAGVDVHIGVCELLRLCQQHGVELEVTDEGDYWETGDRQRLAERMGFLDAAIGLVRQQAGKIVSQVLGEDAVVEEAEVEAGKTISAPLPDWRRDWGISAHEN